MYRLRKATLEDAKLLFDWANTDEARATAIVKKKIAWDEHIYWLISKLQSNQTFIYILTNCGNVNIGVLRFDKNNNVFVISFFIDQSYRKKGMGYMMLRLGIEKMVETETQCTFVASVQMDNIPSNIIFTKMGFKLEKTNIINEHVFNVYSFQINS